MKNTETIYIWISRRATRSTSANELIVDSPPSGARHVKTLRSQKQRMLLTHRKLMQSKAIAIENDLRATLRTFGLKVGVVGTVKFEARIKELVENLPDLVVLVEPLLIVRRVLREQIGILHRR